ncbi:MAG: sulfur carrier protein ThiS [Deltaproteobacteria bacterium]|jgi:sulfur carrier protein|nr:sulfur carrier protein ThiS [Deltaproteobacteria bacterium]
MDIIVSGVKKTFAEGLTVAQLLIEEKVESPEYVTVAVNEEFVEGEAKAARILTSGDQVEFLYFMGGGR